MPTYSRDDIEGWVDEHGDMLFAYALSRLGERGRAEDAVQETYVAALRGIDLFSGQSSPQTWLVGILKHKIVDQIRKSAREQALEEENLDDLFNALGHYKSVPRPWARPCKAVASPCI